MKKIILPLVFLFLFSCSGSDSYQGNWKAMDSKGNKFEFFFSANNFSIKDSTGKSKMYSYVQNSFKHENSTNTYGIQLKDGREYEIYFPKNDESIGLIKDENDSPMFTISRKNYITYEDIYKLK